MIDYGYGEYTITHTWRGSSVVTVVAPTYEEAFERAMALAVEPLDYDIVDEYLEDYKPLNEPEDNEAEHHIDMWIRGVKEHDAKKVR